MSEIIFGGTMEEMDDLCELVESIGFQGMKLQLYQEHWLRHGYDSGEHSEKMVDEVVYALNTAVSSISSILDGISSKEQRELLQAYFGGSGHEQ